MLVAGCATGNVEDKVQPQTVEREEGCNLLTFYWKGTADLATSDIWIWWEGKDGSGYPLVPCEYGGKCTVNVPEYIKEVGFIVRTDCSDPCQNYWGDATKDWAEDRTAVITGDTEIYLITGNGAQYKSDDGGVTLQQIRFFNLAGIISPTQIRYFIAPGNTEIAGTVRVSDGTRNIEVTGISDMWLNGTSGIINLAEELDIATEYEVSIDGYGVRTAIPTEIFDSESFIANYTYDGDDLGSTIISKNGKQQTVFKVWAPTASSVVLNLYKAGDGGEAYAQLPMEKQAKGVWSLTCPCGHGTYYTYSVTTAAGTQEAVDPYAKATGVNGNRAMVIDLDSTDPAGFDKDGYVSLTSYSDAVIWEIHVRDFSNMIESSKYKGKYLAFTEKGLKNSSGLSVGTDYLKELGITHVHLQPVYDYATVDETRLDEPQFNWGYDPKNYNTPEGSYSTDPYHGEVRVNEFKQMVQALHDAGLGVVMDVVYNHTYDINSCLNKVVPYYYYRYTTSGTPSNGSGCGNETASERIMFRRYMVDSLKYWMTEYHIDGFRFDLMAIHDIETMAQIEKALHEINPSAIIYGEGWAGGTVAIPGSEQATQGNIGKISATNGAAGSISVFNDSIRDGLKGSVFSLITKGYINGSASTETANKVSFGIRGGVKTNGTSWSVRNGMVVNYMSAHDNYTLWDKLVASNKGASRKELLAMQRLGASIMMISKGTPFMLAGEEMLRTKHGDGNSYMSSDAINNIDWEAIKPDSDEYAMAGFYRDLIAMRKNLGFFGDCDVTCRIMDGNALEVTYRVHGNVKAMAVINPNDVPFGYSLPSGDWYVAIGADGYPANGASDKQVSPQDVQVAGKSVFLVYR